MRARATWSLVVAALAVAGCGSSEKPADPGPGETGPRAPGDREPAPGVTPKGPVGDNRGNEITAGDLEISPISSGAAFLLDNYHAGGLDAKATAAGLDRLLGATTDGLVDGKEGWRVSAKRTVALAIVNAPAPLRSEVRRIHDDRVGAEAAAITTELSLKRFARPFTLVARYPATVWGDAVRAAIAKDRESVHDFTAVSSLAGPVAAGGVSAGGITVKGDGDDALVATTGDGTRCWDVHFASKTNEPSSVRVLGVMGDRLVVLETTKAGPVNLVGVDVATGNRAFSVAAFPARDEKLLFALAGTDAILAAPGLVVVVDVYRGALAWQRPDSASSLPTALAGERIVFGQGWGGLPAPQALEIAAGRLAGGSEPRPVRPPKGTKPTGKGTVKIE